MRSALAVTLLVVVAAGAPPAAAGIVPKPPAQGRSETGDPLLDYKLRASRAETAHKEMRRAADELVELSGSFARDVAGRGQLTDEDVKAVDKMRKLAKRIRSDMGGMGDTKLVDPPQTVPAAAAALGARGEALAAHLRKASRFEMNARLISLTGEMIALLEILKRLKP
jgi:hypothetical protein